MKHFLTFSCAICILIFCVPIPAAAQWSTDPNLNNAISTAAFSQLYPAIVSDGAGGAIITWDDYRSGAHIYAQRINASGVVVWSADGVAISTAPGNQWSPTIVSDSAGGAIITWQDNRSGPADIYAQRINASGAVQWTDSGVAISTAANDQADPTIVSDDAGGAIIAWDDYRSGADIYVQRVNASGEVQWTANGVAISTAANAQEYPTITSDSAGGAIITWRDSRSINWDIYAQRIDAFGAVEWTANGVPISTAAGDQYFSTIVSDGAGGAIITWDDYRSTNRDIYAQRINAFGAVQWTANGVPISTAAGHQMFPTIASDETGGAIITWYDNADIYTQRINASGAVQWTANGVGISTAADEQDYPNITSDGAGGAIITWNDRRSGTNYDIYAQRINASGAVQWTANGVAISTAAGNQAMISISGRNTIVSDGTGGAIITWADNRTSWDIYAQQVSANGQLGVVTDVQNDVAAFPESFRLEQNYPNPFNPSTTISFSLPSKSFVSLKVFDLLGREVALLRSEELPAGSYSRHWSAEGLPSGVYFYRLQAGSFIETKKLILLR